NHKAFMVLFYQALDGKLSREEWVRGCSRLEYNALQRTKGDFTKLWLPLAGTRFMTITKSFWGADTPATYESWISPFRDPNDYPWDVFGAYYDSKIVPYLKHTRGFQSVKRKGRHHKTRNIQKTIFFAFFAFFVLPPAVIQLLRFLPNDILPFVITRRRLTQESSDISGGLCFNSRLLQKA